MRDRQLIRLLAAVLLLAGSVSAFAQEQTIRGRVFAADNQASLPRARLTIAVDRSAGLPAYTDDRGEFSMVVPSAATFTLSVVKAGYVAVQMPLRRTELASAGAPELVIALTRSAAVNGRVVDTTGETLVGQRVYADRLDADASTLTGLVKFAATTDDRGEYRLGGLPPGRYSVTATGAQDPGAVATFNLQPGDDLVGIDFTALPPRESAVESSPQPPETPERATIRGRVLSTAGRPIARAAVNITGPMPPRYFVTDARGGFTFTALAPGDYDVSASRGDFLPTPFGQESAFESARRISVSPGARVDDVTLTLSRGLAVTGTIVDRNGEPVQGVSVQALRLNTSGDRRRAVLAGALVGGNRQTDDRGRYRVLGLLPGTYVIAAIADAALLGSGTTVSQSLPIYFPGSASITDAVAVTITTTELEGIDFTLADPPTARVTGVVLDSTGAPLEGTVALAVSRRSGSIIPIARTTAVGPGGTFTFINVAPGDYVVSANRRMLPRPELLAQAGAPFGESEFAAQYVTVGDGDAEPVPLRTARGSIMEGRITVDSPALDDPYGRMQLEMHPVDADLAPTSVTMSGNFRQATNGRFRLTGLIGPRRIVVSGLPDGWFLKAMTINGSDMTDEVIDFGVGASSAVVAELIISAEGGSIAGRVTAERGRAVAGSRVIVFPEDRGKWFERSRFVKVVRASQNGSFRAASLPPGDYYVAATTVAAGSDEPTEADFERLMSRATRVTLDEGEARRVDVPLP
ncbi:MAG TPA: carboxypeptidase-like regulatory domain-containing protein [Vicinamibacterales bacterium]|nr:carboxypeptidase-like regulatory domain-containing protein [Vicinamibacterales bacterium]